MTSQECSDTAQEWLRLFPDSDYRLPMIVRPGDVAHFWRQSPNAENVLTERRRWIAEAEDRHLLFPDESQVAADEAVLWFFQVTVSPFADACAAACGQEPDWVLLSSDEHCSLPVIGSAVVFPSGWALAENIGLPLARVHAPAPALKNSLGGQINGKKLRPPGHTRLPA